MTEIAYAYRVERTPTKRRSPWQLGVVRPDGGVDRMESYRTMQQAANAARLLAGRSGKVEVRP